MKKIRKALSIILAVILLISALPTFAFNITASAATSGTTGKCTWTLDGTVLTISGSGTMDNYTYSSPSPWGTTITNVIIEGNVTNIGFYAFYNCSSLTSIEIPDSVTSIGKHAFSYCRSLTSVTIPNRVTSISDYTFSYCQSLTSIIIPNSVTSIGKDAFNYCNKLTNITIPDSVTSIGDYAFDFCRSLTNITLPDSVTSIGEGAFEACTSLTSIIIPDNVTSISDYLFAICKSLTNITLPAKINNIGRSAFAYCDSLATISIPNSVTNIEQNAFNDCTNLRNVYYSGTKEDWDQISIGLDNECLINATWHYNHYGVSHIVTGTTGDCTWSLDGTVLTISGSGTMGNYYWESTLPWGKSITTVIIQKGVTRIGDRAFYDCDSLTSVTIPDSITSMGYFPFYSCDKITSINVDANNSCYSSLNGVLFNKNMSELILYPIGKTASSYSIPDSVTSIHENAFEDCKSLTSVTMSDSVTSIGDAAFRSCEKLKSITIPNSVTSIDRLAFENCKSLTNVTIGNSVTSIGDWAFGYCTSLKTVTIPKSITSIGNYAFYNYTYKSLKDVYYCGTEEEWNNILIGSDNRDLIAATRYYHDFVNGVCSICNIMSINSVSIAVGTDIMVNYYFEDGANSSMRFTVNGKEIMVDGYYDSIVGKYVYRLLNIAPDRLGDKIKAELIKDGEVIAIKESFTVKQYLNTILSKTAEDFSMAEEDFAKLKTLAADLLHYGAAAQKYFGYKTNELVNDGITDGTMFVAPETTAKDVTNKSSNGVTFTGQNLRFDSVNRLMFRFDVDSNVIRDITKLSIKIVVGDEIKIVSSKDFEKVDNNTYIVYTDEIFATEFDEVFTVTACVDGVDGANVKYSVNSYVYAMCNSTTASEEMIELAKATYNYGLSAKAYSDTLTH